MSSENEQVRKNLVFNILSLLANIAVGIFYTPFLVKSLGVVAYGVIPLALIINQYIGVITGSLTGALTRFYSIALQKNDKLEASKSLSTSFIVITAIVLLLVVPIYILIENVDKIFTIPKELVNDSKKLFFFTAISFVFSLYTSIFNVTLYAFNRLDLLNIVKIIRVTGKWLFVLFIYSFISVNVAYVGLANLLTELFLLVFSIIVFSRFSKGKVSLSLKKYDTAVLKAIGFMALWTIVHQLGDTALYRIDNILVNIFWSSKESGILGAFTELGNYTIVISTVIGSLFGPLILIAYANNRHEEVKQMTLDRSLSVGILVAVMSGVLAGFSPILLKIWLGEEFVEYNAWLILKLFLVPFYASAGVFSFAARAFNKVRFPAIMTVGFGFLNFSLLYGLAFFANQNLDYINWMLTVALIIGIGQSYFLNGLYFSKFYEGTRRQVLINFLKILLVLFGVFLVTSQLTSTIQEVNSVVLILLKILIISLILLLICLKVFLNKSQYSSLVNLIYKK